MNKIFNKKIFSPSNIIFVIAVVILLYPPSREWFMRQIAFSPSVENAKDAEILNTYDWQLKGLNTADVNFDQFKGKVVFINFWATWCPPCRAEMPMIQELYNDYKDKIEFVFVTNEDWPVVEKFFKKNEYNLPVYNSLGTPPQKFTETNSIPASYLIDKDGQILISETGAANWNSNKVRQLLDDLIKK
jgi:thiol-disulfide isomerase/thioredoxin